ncbi:MAG: AAA family ATPase, partial [Planctomycetes bacterium]|nr:AAA family ATPase [Planctomycetota bacterium]
VKAFQSLSSFDLAKPFGAWISKITANLCIDHYRRKRLTLVSLDAPMSRGHRQLRYEIDVSAQHGCVRREGLCEGNAVVFSSTDLDNPLDSPVLKVKYFGGKRGRAGHLRFEKSRPVLHQLLRHERCLKDHRAVIEACISSLSNTQRIDPSPTVLRDYSQAHLVNRMGERGENFAALVKKISGDADAKSAYVTWLRQLTPAEIDDVVVLYGAMDEPMFAIREAERDYPASILSDGTLRFAAIAAAFFQPDMPEILTIEEIENGVHPSRLRLLVELLKTQASQKRQVMATTHSLIVLAWLNQDDYKTTFFCKRDETTGSSTITPLSEVPRFLKVVEKQPIGDLFAEGWLEGAL